MIALLLALSVPNLPIEPYYGVYTIRCGIVTHLEAKVPYIDFDEDISVGMNADAKSAAILVNQFLTEFGHVKLNHLGCE